MQGDVKMNEMKNINVGTNVQVKICGRIVDATIEEILDAGYMVKSCASGKVFRVKDVILPEAQEAAPVEMEISEPAQEDAEQIVAEEPRKKMTLVQAALLILKSEQRPMGTKEIVTLAAERNLWTVITGKTPERTLYTMILNDMKKHGNENFRKAAKGKFEYASANC
jgi:hypothetical protein